MKPPCDKSVLCEDDVDDKNPIFEIDETEVDELVIDVPTSLEFKGSSLFVKDIASFKSSKSNINRTG